MVPTNHMRKDSDVVEEQFGDEEGTHKINLHNATFDMAQEVLFTTCSSTQCALAMHPLLHLRNQQHQNQRAHSLADFLHEVCRFIMSCVLLRELAMVVLCVFLSWEVNNFAGLDQQHHANVTSDFLNLAVGEKNQQVLAPKQGTVFSDIEININLGQAIKHSYFSDEMSRQYVRWMRRGPVPGVISTVTCDKCVDFGFFFRVATTSNGLRAMGLFLSESQNQDEVVREDICSFEKLKAKQFSIVNEHFDASAQLRHKLKESSLLAMSGTPIKPLVSVDISRCGQTPHGTQKKEPKQPSSPTSVLRKRQLLSGSQRVAWKRLKCGALSELITRL